MSEESSPHPAARPLPHRLAICLLLFLSITHVVLSSFHANFSLIDLVAYEQGTERNPYQSRIAMAWVLRAAHNNSAITRLSDSLARDAKDHPHSTFNNMTPEVLASILVGLLASYALLAGMIWIGRKRHGLLWWMPSALLVGMIALTLSSRYETTVWYPYDLPHMALFGACCICILEGWWLPAFFFFLIDIPVRETSIFLAALVAAVAFARGERIKAIALPVAMVAFWLPFRIYMRHLFAHNPSETGIRMNALAHIVTDPFHWPQWMSAFGFLLLPLLWGASYLTRTQRFFLLGALPCMVVIFGFGVWTETRILLEWCPAAAILLTFEFSAYLSKKTPHLA